MRDSNRLVFVLARGSVNFSSLSKLVQDTVDYHIFPTWLLYFILYQKVYIYGDRKGSGFGSWQVGRQAGRQAELGHREQANMLPHISLKCYAVDIILSDLHSA